MGNIITRDKWREKSGYPHANADEYIVKNDNAYYLTRVHYQFMGTYRERVLKKERRRGERITEPPNGLFEITPRKVI